MKQILRYLKPYLGKLLAATVLIALSTLCDLLLPTWMSAILNGGIAVRDFPAIAVRCLQMLAIARALINSPAVLLADEPSGNLDSHNRDEIHRLFFELRDRLGQTIVIVTHDEHLAAMADRRITMSDGRIL